MQIDLLLTIISFYSAEKLLIHASVRFFCFTQLWPFLASTVMAHRGVGFLLSHIPHNPAWPGAAKDSSSFHAGDL